MTPRRNILTKTDVAIASFPLILLFALMTLACYAHEKKKPEGWPTHYRVASSKEIRGKGELHRCLDYAIELRTQLYMEAELYAEFVFFNWWNARGEKGTHVALIYWDDHGNAWAVDNQTVHPRRVQDDNNRREVAQLFAPPDVWLEVIDGQVDEMVKVKSNTLPPKQSL